jgi:hypothetical protein
MTPNEARAAVLGLPPSEQDEADVLAFNGVPLSRLASGNITGVSSATGDPRKRVRFGVVETKDAPNAALFDQLRLASEAKTERAVRAVLRELQTEIRAAVGRSDVIAELLVRVEQIFLVHGRTAITKDTVAALRQVIADAVDLEVANVAGAGVVGVFDVKPLRAIARLSGQEQRIRDMMGRNWTDLRRSLADGLAAGETTSELNSRTSLFFDGMRANAATIARTEVNAAINGATQDVAIAAVKLGADVVSVWVTAGDELVRTPPKSSFDHRQANGLTIIPGREIFVVSGERLEYPGDSWNGASAGNTINCRCGIRNEVRKPNTDDNRGSL